MKFSKKIVLTLLSLSIFIYAVDYGVDYYHFRLELKAVDKLIHDRIPESISQHDTSDWKRVKSKFGISMMLPKNFVIEEFTDDDETPVILFWELYEPTGALRSDIFEDNSDKGAFTQLFGFDLYKRNKSDDILFSLQRLKYFSNEELLKKVIKDESCFTCSVPFVRYSLDPSDKDDMFGQYYATLGDLGIVVGGLNYYLPSVIQTISIP